MDCHAYNEDIMSHVQLVRVYVQTNIRPLSYINFYDHAYNYYKIHTDCYTGPPYNLGMHELQLLHNSWEFLYRKHKQEPYVVHTCVYFERLVLKDSLRLESSMLAHIHHPITGD